MVSTQAQSEYYYRNYFAHSGREGGGLVRLVGGKMCLANISFAHHGNAAPLWRDPVTGRGWINGKAAPLQWGQAGGWQGDRK